MDASSSVPTVAQINKKRYAYLIISSIVLLVMGLLYAWSIFAVPLHDLYSWEMGVLQVTFTISMVCFCISQVVSSYIVKAFGHLKTCVLAGLCLVAGFGGTAVFASTSLVGIYVCYGIIASFGCGVGYLTVVAQNNRWFPDKIGFASGVMLMGFGLGGLILGTAASMSIDIAGLPITFWGIGIVGFVLTVFLGFFIKDPPEDIIAILNSANTAGKTITDDAPDAERVPIKTAIYWVYSIWAICSICVGLTFIGSAKQGALLVGIDPTMATLVVGFVSTANGVSRLVIGAIYDKGGLRAAMLLDAVINAAAAVLIMVSFKTGSASLYMVIAVVLGFSYGGIPVIASSFSREQFGGKNYQRNLAICNTNIAWASFLGSALVAVFGVEGTSTNVPVWTVMIVLTTIALASSFVLFAMQKKSFEQYRAAQE